MTGNRYRERTVVVYPSYFGRRCEHLKESEECGENNGGCDHECHYQTGNCYCDRGYELKGESL